MSLLQQLSDKTVWEEYLSYKASLLGKHRELQELQSFCDRQEYLPICRQIAEGTKFPLPQKSVLSKQGSDKKRTVYTYPYAWNQVLRLLTHLMLRRYDGLFCRGLYSFRPGRSAKDAVRSLLRLDGLEEMYCYKADIHDYFNSIPMDQFLPLLDRALQDDPELLIFLRGLLEEPAVMDRGKAVKERKGIMAGTPQACFYANLYLHGLDLHFHQAGVPYMRYSDDIILFAPTREEMESRAGEVRAFLSERGLEINPKKESFSAPGEGWTFLGFRCEGETVDIAAATVTKLKHKMRRKARALQRWANRKGLEGEKAAKAFIRVFNRKLLESPEDNELSWSFWFFSVINTDRSLREIDRYAQDCIRYLISGKRNKARYNVRYEDMKRLGYQSLVHAYYNYPPKPEKQNE